MNHVSILIDRPLIFLFAETAYGSDYLRSFAHSIGWEYEVGHGSKEHGTYKDFTCVILDEEKLKPSGQILLDPKDL